MLGPTYAARVATYIYIGSIDLNTVRTLTREERERVANLCETQQLRACGEVFAQWLLSA